MILIRSTVEHSKIQQRGWTPVEMVNLSGVVIINNYKRFGMTVEPYVSQLRL